MIVRNVLAVMSVWIDVISVLYHWGIHWFMTQRNVWVAVSVYLYAPLVPSAYPVGEALLLLSYCSGITMSGVNTSLGG